MRFKIVNKGNELKNLLIPKPAVCAVCVMWGKRLSGKLPAFACVVGMPRESQLSTKREIL